MTEPTPNTQHGDGPDPAAVALRAVPDGTDTTEPAHDPDDERIRVTLHTDNGSADFWVPPMNTWRAQARSALQTRGDTLFWAARTLTQDEAIKWAELDPSADETEPFFEEFMRRSGLGGNRQQRRGGRRSA